ncbi:hypothetical protein SEVIR_6G005233v4 [Setaria viridis]
MNKATKERLHALIDTLGMAVCLGMVRTQLLFVLMAMQLARGGVPCAANGPEAGDIGRAEVGDDLSEDFRQEIGPRRRRRRRCHRWVAVSLRVLLNVRIIGASQS